MYTHSTSSIRSAAPDTLLLTRTPCAHSPRGKFVKLEDVPKVADLGGGSVTCTRGGGQAVSAVYGVQGCA